MSATQIPFSLIGRTALVTGATGYLGKQMCTALAAAGAHVLVNSRNTENCEAFASSLRAQGYLASEASFDVTDETACRTWINARGGKALHIIVNNAYHGKGGTIRTSGSDDFENAYRGSVVATHRLVQLCLPALENAVAEQGSASIINISSMYGLLSPDLRIYDSPEGSNPPFYGAAKAALVQYSRYAACEFARAGIRCNVIAPGPFPNETVQQENPAFIAKLNDKVPMARIGRADEIGGPVVFLASDAASYVNGTVLTVDGGFTAW